ncbi:hypothetical protein ABT095_24150 [Kitasatospora sp. NPDC002227]|uniref:hypothetical protein n=1 Tax=Kitasatospora sp. NPDC002227 TaxID=3154773 RepID=UPI00331F68FC
MKATLLGHAANPALPADLLARLLDTADEEVLGVPARRADLDAAQLSALAARSTAAAVSLAHPKPSDRRGQPGPAGERDAGAAVLSGRQAGLAGTHIAI